MVVCFAAMYGNFLNILLDHFFLSHLCHDGIRPTRAQYRSTLSARAYVVLIGADWCARSDGMAHSRGPFRRAQVRVLGVPRPGLVVRIADRGDPGVRKEDQ